MEKFKKKLEGTKAEILADLEKLKEGLDFGDDAGSFDEETDESEEYSNYMGVKKSLEERLKAIEEALDKIDKGTYGICEKCNSKIEPEILEAVPESQLCKKCKSEA
jgi:DnaK suppressor protein